MFRPTLFVSALTCSSLAFASGPLVLGGSAGHTPATYQNPNITLNVESGNLGTLSNAAANTLVSDALALWNNVSTSNINLVIDQTQIPLDIDINNFETYLPNVSNTVFHSNDNLNPVVYDSTGEIIDAFFGVGQSDNTIGFAASVITIGNRYFDEGYAVINGKTFSPPLSNTTFKLLIAHEIGHFIGLDHTQVNINNRETDFGTPGFCSTNIQSAYPLMYPFVCRNEETLHADDISSISSLYPNASTDNAFGTLQGRLVDASGSAILGANVWAENTTTGEVISIASDYLAQGTGLYKLYLPAGSYTLHANSINTLFNGGSAIGPYAKDINDRSFTSPHPITEVTFQGDTPGNDKIISVATNQTQTVDFASDGKTAVITSNSSSSSSNDSIADLFGSMSHITLLMTASLLLLGRLRSRS
jgi:hypothetical protein